MDRPENATRALPIRSLRTGIESPPDHSHLIVNQWPKPLWDNGSANSQWDDTASDTEKSFQHFATFCGSQWKTNGPFCLIAMGTGYLKAIFEGDTVIDTVRLFPARYDQSQPVPRSSTLAEISDASYP
ncbi:hypothetical protein LJ655_15730 [Paraburkholderia sp. MMS20-SJTN17]|uniref:Uncharacterized protein n=1 Tax=Paraburkholderia translucens TaxID=2886945 RepID=A0ABS8KEW6_9BURK|nr:hypothetical protein [Paraburkholderia sp. MMS20-SJTN17]MCC8403324.1 hypothetical protein [Paraburkholderia sp. MMS20-SJTN17]